MFFLPQLLILLVSSVFSQQAVTRPTNQDYLNLKAAISQFIRADKQGPTRNIPLLVRLSFHDLGLYDGSQSKLGPAGCLAVNPTIQNVPANAGIAPIASRLVKFVFKRFPRVAFSLGDVVSLAGKVAVEMAYPCIQIKWGYGRGNCDARVRPSRFSELPSPDITRQIELNGPLSRYGISSLEMAILVAGSHGIKGAQASAANSGFSSRAFSTGVVNSGKDWIQQTLARKWRAQRLQNNHTQFTDGELLRFSSDLLWFPSIAQKTRNAVVERRGREVEDALIRFAGADRRYFDDAFGVVYSRMLNIGVRSALTLLIEPSSKSTCPDISR